MNRIPTTALAAAALATLASAPAEAQTAIRAGESLRGFLSTSDARLDDGSHYDLYDIRGEAGERLVIDLRSDDFDAYLVFGNASGSGLDLLESDDDGGSGTDSRVEVTLPRSGLYRIRANSLGAGETGAYTLSVESRGHGPASGGGAPSILGEVRPGESVRGTLGAGDPTLDDGSRYQDWIVRAPAGRSVVVTLESEDFDAYLHWGRVDGATLDVLESDDDGGSGTDSRLEVTPRGDGTYVARVNSLWGGASGDYVLRVRSGGGLIGREAAGEIRAGETRSGRLESGDRVSGDDSYYDAWTFRGRAGERVAVTLRSDDFDAYLRVGRRAGGEFEAIETDDDGAGGLDAMIVLTLPETGLYEIQANSLSVGETGSYRLTVESSR